VRSWDTAARAARAVRRIMDSAWSERSGHERRRVRKPDLRTADGTKPALGGATANGDRRDACPTTTKTDGV